MAGMLRRLARMVPGLVLILWALCAQGQTVYYHNDASGTPLAASNEAGALLWQESYRAWGERLIRPVAGAGNSVWFHGKAEDGESALLDFGARYYDPVVGRFMGPDPAGFHEAGAHSFNRYAYGNNNPYKYRDPDGRLPVLVVPVLAWMGGGAAVSGGVNALIQYLTTGEVRWGGLGGVADAAGEGAILGPALGVAASRSAATSAAAAIRFGQRGVSSTFRHGEFAGRSIDDVAAGLRSGAISPNQLPIQTITRDGVTYTINNRSLMALRRAGMEPTTVKEVTGNALFERQLTQRLGELGSQAGPDFVPIIRGEN